MGLNKFIAYLECVGSYASSFGHTAPDPSSVSNVLQAVISKIVYNTCLKFIDEILYLVVEFGVVRTYMYVWVTCAEILLFKIIYMHNYSKISAMDEYFLTNFVTFFNLVIIFVFSMVRICLREHLRTRMYHGNFAEPFEVYRRIYFP